MLAFLAAAAGPAMVAGFALSPSTMSARRGAVSMTADKQRVLVIGGTRFSGLYLTKELHSRGHEVRAAAGGSGVYAPVSRVCGCCVLCVCRGTCPE